MVRKGRPRSQQRYSRFTPDGREDVQAAGAIGGTRDGRPRQSKMFRMALGEWIAATIFIRPRQAWAFQNVELERLISSAHVYSGHADKVLAAAMRHARIERKAEW